MATTDPDATDSSVEGAPRVALLGVCDRAAYVRTGHPVEWRHNLIGIRQAFLSHFYPTAMTGWNLVMCWYDPTSVPPMSLRLVDETGEQLLKFDLTVESREGGRPADSTAREDRAWRLAPAEGPSWMILHPSLDEVVVKHPGRLDVFLSLTSGSSEARIGTIQCLEIDPPPLTPERIAAIRADPLAFKYARARLGCKKCPDELFIQVAIERPTDLDGVTKVWYEDAPDTWTCRCGASVFDLRSIRKNLHGILGPHSRKGDGESNISFIRMYERSSLADTCADFGALLDDEPPEEEVQQFLAAHTVFLHRFAPVKIKAKAPILTKYKTDFAIVDSRGVLVLVEIEKPGIKLLKKDGDITQKLQHAFDQVRSWLHVTKRRRAAVLDCMDFREDEVAAVRGVVVAGRDHPYPSDDLMRLKGTDYGEIEFFTYDDLLKDTVNLAREL